MIRKILLSTVALTTLTGAAFAADLPSRRAPPVYVPPPPIPVFTWTGFYAGGQVGYEFGKTSGLAYNNTNGIGLAAGGASPGGVIGGGHVGYMYSMPSIPYFGGGMGSAVVGIEGDVEDASYKSTYGIGALSDSSNQGVQGSVRGRLGLAVDRALFYATGGAAFGRMGNTYASGLGFDSYSKTKVGYTVGAGVEYALTNNWSVRVEYRYTDFGSTNDTLFNSVAGPASVHHRDTDNRVEAGFSYKFDTFSPLAPVVARY